MVFAEPSRSEPVPDRDPLVDALRERDRFVALAFAASHLLLEIDQSRGGVIAYASGASLGLADGSSKQLVGRAMIDLVADSDRLFFRELMGRLGTLGKLEPTYVQFACADGRSQGLLVGACAVPTREHRLAVSLIMPGPGMARKPGGANGLFSAAEFADVVADRVSKTGVLGRGEDLTLLVIDGLQELRATKGPEAADRATALIGGFLRSLSVGGAGAGDLGEGKFGVLHQDGLDDAEIKRRIGAILEQCGLAPDAGTVTHCVAMAVTVAPGQEADTARALAYTLKQFSERPAHQIDLADLAANAQALSADAVSRIRDVRHIINDGAFTMVFQPVVDMELCEVHHYEALCRPKDRTPQELIRFIEDVGLSQDFDLTVTERVLGQMRRLAGTAGQPDLPVAINLSALSLKHREFLPRLIGLIKRAGPIGRRVMIEITETAQVEDFSLMAKAIEVLQTRGHHVAIDDVGSGTTSFASLYRLPAEFAKIDGHFIRQALSGPKDRAMLQSIIEMAHQLGFRLIGEQIEEQHQALLLANLGVRYGQGWFFGKPAPKLEQPAQLADGPVKKVMHRKGPVERFE